MRTSNYTSYRTVTFIFEAHATQFARFASAVPTCFFRINYFSITVDFRLTRRDGVQYYFQDK